jgi:hypothetical protein
MLDASFLNHLLRRLRPDHGMPEANRSRFSAAERRAYHHGHGRSIKGRGSHLAETDELR